MLVFCKIGPIGFKVVEFVNLQHLCFRYPGTECGPLRKGGQGAVIFQGGRAGDDPAINYVAEGRTIGFGPLYCAALATVISSTPPEQPV